MEVMYWCEFPERCDWGKLASWVGKREIIVYAACTSRQYYESLCKTVGRYSRQITIRAWPVLPRAKGYWFSGFTPRRGIDSLEQYKGIHLKIDLEPPIPKSYTFWSGIHWLFANFFRHADNALYLQGKIQFLSRSAPVIVSTFPLPLGVLRRWGWTDGKNIRCNFMYYRTLVPLWVRWGYDFYYRWFLKRHSGSYFAVGLVSPGIFGNEQVYADLSEMEHDIRFLRGQGVTRMVFFELSGIVQRGKEWFEATQAYTKC